MSELDQGFAEFVLSSIASGVSETIQINGEPYENVFVMDQPFDFNPMPGSLNNQGEFDFFLSQSIGTRRPLPGDEVTRKGCTFYVIGPAVDQKSLWKVHCGSQIDA